MASQTKRRGWLYSGDQEGVNCRERLSRKAVIREFRGMSFEQVARFGGVLHVLVKYLPPRQLGAFLRRQEKHWRRSPWASRQVAAVLGILPEGQRANVRRVLLRYGLADALLVVEHIEMLRAMKTLDPQLRAYLMYRGSSDYPYALPKIVLARTLLRGALGLVAKRQLKAWLLAHVTDPVHRQVIRGYRL